MGLPARVNAVNPVQPERYLGQWHEIARLDHWYERGLVKVSASYSTLPDGGIRVLNRGYDPVSQVWKAKEGKAYFVDPANNDGSRTGKLKVSFFPPFYAAYNIIDLDKNYSYALVSGNDFDTLWILSRKPQLPEATLQQLLSKAQKLGFDTGKLIYPDKPTAE
jgi:apolipoprotein D and lipocalin family protein